MVTRPTYARQSSVRAQTARQTREQNTRTASPHGTSKGHSSTAASLPRPAPQPHGPPLTPAHTPDSRAPVPRPSRPPTRRRSADRAHPTKTTHNPHTHPSTLLAPHTPRATKCTGRAGGRHEQSCGAVVWCGAPPAGSAAGGGRGAERLSLTAIQAQEEGSKEARRKLEQLKDLGFPAVRDRGLSGGDLLATALSGPCCSDGPPLGCRLPCCALL